MPPSTRHPPRVSLTIPPYISYHLIIRRHTIKTFDFTAVVWKEKEGYVSKCPELGVASCGDTITEATANLKEAVELYIENAETLGLMEDIEESLTTREKFTSRVEIAFNA
jgi:predicted RNase H-like HicB family nuclease